MRKTRVVSFFTLSLSLRLSFVGIFMISFVIFFLAILTTTLLCCVSASSSSSSSWNKMLEESRYGHLPPTVFAPNGNLPMVERVARAASSLDVDDGTASLVMALRVDDNSDNYSSADHDDDDESGKVVVVVSTRSASPHVFYPSQRNGGSGEGGWTSVRDEKAGNNVTGGEKEQEDFVKSTNHDNCDEKSCRKKLQKKPLLIRDYYDDDDDDEMDENSNDDDDDDDEVDNHMVPTAPLSILSPTLLVAAAGNAIDSTVLLRRIKEAALTMHRSNDGGAVMMMATTPTSTSTRGMSSSFLGGGASAVESGPLARRIADSIQIATQTVGGRGGRMLASSALIIGVNERETSSFTHTIQHPQSNIWRVDPTGQFWNCDAAAIGRGAGNAEGALMRRIARWKKHSDKMKLKDNANGEEGQHGDESLEESGLSLSLEEEEKEEDAEWNDVIQNLSNDDVKMYLGTLSCDDALLLASECIMGALKVKQPRQQQIGNEAERGQGRGSGDLWREMQAVILRPPPRNNVRGKMLPCVEVLNGKDLENIRMKFQEKGNALI